MPHSRLLTRHVRVRLLVHLSTYASVKTCLHTPNVEIRTAQRACISRAGRERGRLRSRDGARADLGASSVCPHAGPATPTPADSDTERDPKGEYEGDFDAKPGSSFGEALFAWGPPQPSRLQPRQASPPPTPMETPVLPNATDLGGLLSATWVEVPYDELQLLDVIGEGAFGKVHKAKWRGATVAVKALSTDGNGGAMRCVREPHQS